MIVIPKIRGFICTTAHPVGCAMNVQQQINYVEDNYKPLNSNKIQRILVIGASTGYGLASRIVGGFGLKAATIGVFYERAALPEKTGSAGWYNSAAFEDFAVSKGLYAKSINGDAFTNEIKLKTIELIKQDLGQIDLVIYSVAAPRRTVNGINFNSVLKPVAEQFTSKTVDLNTGKVSNITILPATQEELTATIKVMGGEDLELWIKELHSHQVLSKNIKVLAYSYIGPMITYPVYRNGTIGHAKEHLESTLKNLNNFLAEHYHGKAISSVNKALVTQASSAIPVVPLYISLLYRVMKNKQIHEGCIEQITRLFNDYLSCENYRLDPDGRIRLDDLELRPDVQAEVTKLWELVNTENLSAIADLSGYQDDFYKLFGFNVTGVDYGKECDINIPIGSIKDNA